MSISTARLSPLFVIRKHHVYCNQRFQNRFFGSSLCSRISSTKKEIIKPTTLQASYFKSKDQKPLSSTFKQLSISASTKFSLKDDYEFILAEKRFPSTTENVMESGDDKKPELRGGVGLIKLNRPKALNALCDKLFEDLIHAARAFNEDDEVGCVIITGNHKAFAAGADIPEMKDRNFSEAYKTNMFAQWSAISALGKPTIAAVNGFALGGGCELAMMCDIIYAGNKAKFGQPEINLGIIPGAGGTQRLIRAIGKSKAMDMILTGAMISAEQAESDGLVARTFEPENLIDEVLKIAFEISAKSSISVQMAKEAVNAADEMFLNEGLRFERRLFHSLFATKDQKEGMSAFLQKRKPDFTDS